MSRLETTDSIVSEVRSLVNEAAITKITNQDIIGALNRAQSHAFSLLAKHYPDPLVVESTTSLVPGQRDYTMPENIFEDRLEVVEVYDGTYSNPIRRLSFREAVSKEDSSSYPYPSNYYIKGRTIRLVQKPSTAYTLRFLYLREPDTLVKSQGRSSGIGSDYVIVEDIGDDITTTEDDLNNYVNIIDGQTGEIKQTLQINNISGNKISFRSVPSRSSGAILNRTISSSVNIDVELDDYICSVQGTCVPFFLYPIKSFLIAHTVAEIKAIQDRDHVAEDALRKDFEKMLLAQDMGRSNTRRVTKYNQVWARRTLR